MKKNNGGFIQIILILVIVATLIGGAYYFGTKNQVTSPSPVASTQPSGSPIVIPKADPATANWKVYKVPGLGIEFKLPNFLSPLDYPFGNETVGEKGKQFCVEYTKVDMVSFFVKNVLAGGGACLPQYFGLGTTSIEYEAGREYGFSDSQGYTFENGKYFAKTGLSRKDEIPMELVKEIVNPNGIKILRIIGKSEQPSIQNEMTPFPIMGTPGNGRIGALINLTGNTSYSGVSVEMKLEGKLNVELFDQILSTFKFTK